jgi:hypothetical protein
VKIKSLFKSSEERAARRSRPPSRRALKLQATALAAAFLFAIAAPAFARHAENVSHQATPQATVRDFLNAAVVDNDGVTACRYLTPRARLSFEHHAPYQRSCESYFGSADLTLGGLHVQSRRDLNELAYRVVPVGSARRVDVSHDGQSLSFVLRPASPPDLEEFWAPPTPWRIDSSVAALGAAPQSPHLADL